MKEMHSIMTHLINIHVVEFDKERKHKEDLGHKEEDLAHNRRRGEGRRCTKDEPSSEDLLKTASL